MSLQKTKFLRRILPRWRDSRSAPSGQDFLSLKNAKPLAWQQSSLQQKIADFNLQPSIGTAAELMSIARLERVDEEAQRAAQFLLEQKNRAPESILILARSISTGVNEFTSIEQDINKQVAHVRAQLRLQPRNAMLWSDLSRHYASIGDRRRALRSMQTARSLEPDHRWLLRTAARFLVHQEDPISAHKLLASHPRTRHDPWLIAAELACAQVANRAPKFWSQAKDILRFDRFSPSHVTELATAVAMFELEEGKRKHARKLVERALVAPTENTLAQVFWAQEDKHLPDGQQWNELVHRANAAFEAEYRLHMNDGNLLAARKSVGQWLEDEPFAARPCGELAFIASLLDDYETTSAMSKKVLQLDGHLPIGVELNSIFMTLSAGKYKDPQEPQRIQDRLLKIIEEGRQELFHAVANLGLWEFRHGDAEFAVTLYQKSIEIAQKQHNHESAAMASVFASREAILAHHESAHAFLAQAHELAPKVKNKSIDFYLRKVDALRKAPEKKEQILNPGSASEFLVMEKKVANVIRIEHSAKGATIWISS